MKVNSKNDYSDMHYRRNYKFNHTETALIEVALENLQECFEKGKDTEYVNKVKRLRKSFTN